MVPFRVVVTSREDCAEVGAIRSLWFYIGQCLFGEIQDRKVCEQHAMAMRPGILLGTSLIRNTPPLGLYSSPMPRDLWWS